MPSQHKRHPLTVRVPQDVEDALREQAAERGLTLGAAVTEALRAWIERHALAGELEAKAVEALNEAHLERDSSWYRAQGRASGLRHAADRVRRLAAVMDGEGG